VAASTDPGLQPQRQVTAQPTVVINLSAGPEAMYYNPGLPACSLYLDVYNPNAFPVSVGTVSAYYNFVPLGSSATQYDNLTLGAGVAVLQPQQQEQWRYTFDDTFQWATAGRGKWAFQFHIPVTAANAAATTLITQWFNLTC